ncbi:MAG: NADH dehydrogenase subunit J [bacterium]|nr:MAG: NADH dehydrogenase subunit J [bacterium]
MHLLIFYVLGFFAVFAAVSMVTARRPIISALFLILNMLCLAGFYAQLDAHLIAVLQVMVYAGVIMALVLFVIMLLNIGEKRGIITRHRITLQVIGMSLLAVVMVSIVGLFNAEVMPGVKEPAPDFGTVKAVGRILFTDYLLPFEIASILLLAAIVGAVILSKRKV